jgi:hypothetical protein
MLWFKKYIFSELHYKTSKWLLPFVVPLTESSMDELSSLVLSCKGELFGWLGILIHVDYLFDCGILIHVDYLFDCGILIHVENNQHEWVYHNQINNQHEWVYHNQIQHCSKYHWSRMPILMLSNATRSYKIINYFLQTISAQTLHLYFTYKVIDLIIN